MHTGENAFEALLYLYKQCKHHTKDAFSVYKLIHLVITAKTGEHDFTGGEYRSSDHFRR